MLSWYPIDFAIKQCLGLRLASQQRRRRLHFIRASSQSSQSNSSSRHTVISFVASPLEKLHQIDCSVWHISQKCCTKFCAKNVRFCECRLCSRQKQRNLFSIRFSKITPATLTISRDVFGFFILASKPVYIVCDFFYKKVTV